MDPMKLNKDVFERLTSGGPLLFGMFAVGKIESGERVNPEKNGKREPFAVMNLVIIANRKSYTVKVNAKGEEQVSAWIKAKGDFAKEDSLMPAKPGSPVYVEISSVKNDKGLQTINGKVIPLSL
jgi:hypothetical protein